MTSARCKSHGENAAADSYDEKTVCSEGVMGVHRNKGDRSETLPALVQTVRDSVHDAGSSLPSSTRTDPSLLLHGHVSMGFPQTVPPHGAHHRCAIHSSTEGHSRARTLNWCDTRESNAGGAVDRLQKGIPDEKGGGDDDGDDGDDAGAGLDDTRHSSSTDRRMDMMSVRDGDELKTSVPHDCPGADAAAWPNLESWPSSERPPSSVAFHRSLRPPQNPVLPLNYPLRRSRAHLYSSAVLQRGFLEGSVHWTQKGQRIHQGSWRDALMTVEPPSANRYCPMRRGRLSHLVVPLNESPGCCGTACHPLEQSRPLEVNWAVRPLVR